MYCSYKILKGGAEKNIGKTSVPLSPHLPPPLQVNLLDSKTVKVPSQPPLTSVVIFFLGRFYVCVHVFAFVALRILTSTIKHSDSKKHSNPDSDLGAGFQK